jgi:alpha-amylase
MKWTISRVLSVAGACLLTVAAAGCGSSSSAPAPWAPGQPLTLDVGATFPAGTVVRDAYTGTTATVAANGSVTVTPDAAGVVLLERSGVAPTPFQWQNATVYFALTDRFNNGDPSNDGSYGRKKDGGSEIGTWHGGDWKGLTAKLPYLSDLGVTALWISPIVEQVHGWVAGASGDFKYWGYTGYWALDFTRLDRNWGSAADLQELVDQAHQRGIRVIVDVVMNHPGYATGADLLSYLPEVFHDGTGAAFTAYDAAPHADLRTWNDLVNYQSTGWTNWWSPAWIRAGSTPQEFPGFDHPGQDDLTRSLTFLPDFKTEATGAAGIPVLLTRKAATPDGTGATPVAGATVRDYLVKWHTDWVRQFGFDGFRCDTAKNVELGSWKALKTAGAAALAEWKTANPAKSLDGGPFWMTGEVYGHGVTGKDEYFTEGGFDSLINFGFQPWLRDTLAAKPALVDNADDLDALYARYASLVSSDPTYGILSYLSSHDTRLWFTDIALTSAKQQRQAGTALLLAPGGVQVFYGDESGRVRGPNGSDDTQGTRSDMNWSTTDASILAHFRKLATFRKSHAAVGAGTHAKIASPAGTYAFTRTMGTGASQDAVLVVIGAGN